MLDHRERPARPARARRRGRPGSAWRAPRARERRAPPRRTARRHRSPPSTRLADRRPGRPADGGRHRSVRSRRSSDSVDPRRQVARPPTRNRFDLAGPRDDPAVPRKHDDQRRRERDERQRSAGGPRAPRVGRSVATQPARARSSSRSAGADLEQVADDEEVGEFGDRGVGVAVDGDDRLGRLHPDLVLDRAADPEREVQLRLDDLAGLADLLGVRDPAGVDGRARRPDGAAERLRELLDEAEALRAADAATAGDDDPGLLDRRGGTGLGDAIDDRDRRAAPGRRRRRPDRLPRCRAIGAASAVTTFGRTVTMPRPLGERRCRQELATEDAHLDGGPSSVQATAVALARTPSPVSADSAPARSRPSGLAPTRIRSGASPPAASTSAAMRPAATADQAWSAAAGLGDGDHARQVARRAPRRRRPGSAPTTMPVTSRGRSPRRASGPASRPPSLSWARPRPSGPGSPMTHSRAIR